jgi:acyl-coenzyme A synthetase/AMP-(fatty) acid ligase
LPGVALQSLADVLEDQSVADCALREIITAGEQLRITPAIARLFGTLKDCRLHNHYGPTETHVVTAFTMPSERATWPELPPIGRPISNARIYILDPNGRLVPRGVIGELYVGGEVLARGYLRQPQLTAERFVPDGFSPEPGARMYRTGDLARHRADGNIDFLGRNDFQVKVRGFRIEPGEIEAQLEQHPAVQSAVVIVRNDSAANKRLVAYFIPREAIAAEALRTHLAERLPEYMIPATFVQLADWPLTPSGKLDRRALPDAAAVGSAEGNAPVGTIELRLAAIWADVLGITEIERDADFFDLGGHSLLGTVVVLRIRSELGVDLALEDIFRAPLLTQLARAIELKRLGSLASAEA